MAAEGFQVDNTQLTEKIGRSIHKQAGKKKVRMNYYESNIGEANYRKACGLLAVMLEQKKVSVKEARRLLQQIETRLRVDRGAISLEVMLAESSNYGCKTLTEKNKKAKMLGTKGDLKGCDFGVKTVNYRIKIKGKGKHLF